MLRNLPRRHFALRSKSLRLESLEPRHLLHAGAADHHDEPAYVPGELIVGFDADVAQLYALAGEQQALNTARGKVAAHGLTNPVALAHRPPTHDRGARLTTVWHTDPDQDLLHLAEEIAALPGVAYAEPNFIITASTSHAPQFPNDSRFSQLWGMHNDAGADIDAPQAWGISTGSGNTVVAIIDTGINYNHPDLVANIWTNPLEIPGDGIDNDGNGYPDDIHGWDFVNDDADPLDDDGHGTHVAGTVGAVGNNGTGVVGVTWDVDLMALKFLDSNGSGTTADAIEALEYLNATITALGDNGFELNVAATNNSWSGGGFSQALEDAVAASGVTPYSDGILFVAAAGNNGNSSAAFPAAFTLSNVISVAATDENDQLASFSNFGENVDLAAPGVNILSTKGNSYGKLSGTSMAAPHVTGAAALVWDLYGSAANVANVKSAILDNVDLVPALNGQVETDGRLNVAEALKAVEMEVVSSSPAAGEIINSATDPELFTVNFSHPVADGVILTASDFSVVGPGGTTVANSAAVSGDRMSITYTFDTSPLMAEGPHTMSLNAAAVTTSAHLWDTASQAWTSGTFYFDTSPLVVQSLTTDAVDDGIGVVDLNGAPVTVSVQFSEVIDASSVDVDDLILSQGAVTGINLSAPNLVEYIVEGLSEQGTWNISMPPGAVLDADQNPVAAASWSRILDITSAAFPTPLFAAPPAGSRIYEGTTTGVLDHPSGDTDQFTLAVDGGQTVTVVVRPDSNLTPSINIPELSGASASGAMPGEPVYLQTVNVPSDTTLTISLASVGLTSGGYELDVLLGAAADQVGNGNVASAQDIDDSFVDIAGGAARRAAVRGTASRTIPPLATENESGDAFLSKQNDLRGSWTLTGDIENGMPVWQINDGAGVTGNVGSRSGSGPLASTDDQDTFFFQARAGDMLTASAPGFRVDLHDLTGDQLADGSGSFSWTFSEDGDYFVHVYQNKGNYQLNLHLATLEDLSGSDANLDFYEFTPLAGEQIRLVGDTPVSQASVELQLLDDSGTLLATSTPIAGADALLEYTATGTAPLVVRATVQSAVESDDPIDYGLVVLGSALYELEPNSAAAAPQTLPQENSLVLGQLGLDTTNVLWVGGATDTWSDANFQIDQVDLVDLPADLSPYQTIYVDSLAGVPDNTQAASIAAFVSSGGGLVTENGGDESSADYSWVPNAGDGFTWEPLGSSTSQGPEADIVQRTVAGRVHPVTAGISDAHLSNWAVAVHNLFPDTGTMTAVAENGQGVAALLVGDHGQGRLAYLGMDASGHQSRLDGARLVRQTTAWAGNPGTETDFYSVQLASGDQLDLSLTKPSTGSGEYENEWLDSLRLLAPGGGEVAAAVGSGSLTHVATTSGTYLIEVSSTDGVGGDYALAVELSQVPPEPGIIVSPTTGLETTEAGGQDQFTIVLTTDPLAEVTIPLSSSDTGEGTVSPSQVVFDSSNWWDPQTVTVSGQQDTVEDGDQQYMVITGLASATPSTSAYHEMDAADVTVINLDDDGAPAAVTVDSISPSAMGVNASVDVVISGANFDENGATVSLQNGTGPAPSVLVTSITSSEIHATFTTNGKGPNKDRVWDVCVTNPDGSSACLVQQFTVSPSITSLALATVTAATPTDAVEELPENNGPRAKPRRAVRDALAAVLASYWADDDAGVTTADLVTGQREATAEEAGLPRATDAVFENELSLREVFGAAVGSLKDD